MSDTKKSGGFQVQVTREFTDDEIRDILISAFEGGSNYWYMIERHDYAGIEPREFQGGGKYANSEYQGSLHLYLLPFGPGTALIIKDNSGEAEDDKEYRLDRAALQRGLDLLSASRTYAHHWRDLVTDNGDSTTGDVFLQFCLFGDVVYW